LSSARADVATDGGVALGSIEEEKNEDEDLDELADDRERSSSVRFTLHDVALEHVAGGEGELLALDFEPFWTSAFFVEDRDCDVKLRCFRVTLNQSVMCFFSC
jgi:hypothetical protein